MSYEQNTDCINIDLFIIFCICLLTSESFFWSKKNLRNSAKAHRSHRTTWQLEGRSKSTERSTMPNRWNSTRQRPSNFSRERQPSGLLPHPKNRNSTDFGKVGRKSHKTRNAQPTRRQRKTKLVACMPASSTNNPSHSLPTKLRFDSCCICISCIQIRPRYFF